jgi:hypothetical protein
MLESFRLRIAAWLIGTDVIELVHEHNWLMARVEFLDDHAVTAQFKRVPR